MKTIFKYELQTTDNQSISVPNGGIIRHLDVQNQTPCLWIEVNTTNPLVTRKFVIYGTGHQQGTANQNYVGSYMLADDILVFHVYELI